MPGDPHLRLGIVHTQTSGPFSTASHTALYSYTDVPAIRLDLVVHVCRSGNVCKKHQHSPMSAQAAPSIVCC